MDQRKEALVKLIVGSGFNLLCPDVCCSRCEYTCNIYCEEAKLADHLLANGVVLDKDYQKLLADYEILAKMYAKVNEELCVRTKERDSAVADIGRDCVTCRHAGINKPDGGLCDRVVQCYGDNEDDHLQWEWRGVPEVTT